MCIFRVLFKLVFVSYILTIAILLQLQKRIKPEMKTAYICMIFYLR